MNQPVRRHHRYSYEEFLSHEAASNVKHEFLDGEIYAMAGGSRQHAALAIAVAYALVEGLRGKPCVVHSSDLKVRVTESGLATYPDLTVIRGPAEEDPLSRHVVLNPTVLVEVTSPSSEEWDRGQKLEHYKTISSLKEVVILSHRAREVTVVRRQPHGDWASETAGAGSRIRLHALDCSLDVDDVYRHVTLD